MRRGIIPACILPMTLRVLPCSVVSFLAILTAAGFTLTAVQPFDLFPHTRHVENIMTFDGPL